MAILLATEHNVKCKGKCFWQKLNTIIHHQDHSMILIKYDTEIKPVKVFLCNPISLQNDNKNLAHTYCCWSRKQSNIQKLLRPTFESWYLSCVNPATTMNTWGLKQMKEDWVKQGHASNLTEYFVVVLSSLLSWLNDRLWQSKSLQRFW